MRPAPEPAPRVAGARPRAVAFVARGFGVPSWPEAFAEGRIPGLNDRLAYGYHRAESEGFEVLYSRDGDEGLVGRLARLCVRGALGFDLVHAWRNRALLDGADVVWTHTESQSLAVCALYALRRRVTAPKLLMQSVWLVDAWPTFGPLRRGLYARLLERADVLSFHTRVASDAARALFPGRRVETVPFGVPTEARRAPAPPRSDGPVRLVAVGNDRHRDWRTVVDAFGSVPGVELLVVSRTAPSRLLAAHPNVTRADVRDRTALVRALDGADIGVVAVRPNRHASGITSLQELALRGVPAVASRTGGLTEYFGDDAVTYVPPGDALALREAVARMRAEPEACLAKAIRAGARMHERALSSTAYAHDHVRLSRELLGLPVPGRPGRAPERIASVPA